MKILTLRLILIIPVVIEILENWTGENMSMRSENNRLMAEKVWVFVTVPPDDHALICLDIWVLRLESLLLSVRIPSSNNSPTWIQKTFMFI